jgi:beta-aspartyl-peptidase (threonine type)
MITNRPKVVLAVHGGLAGRRSPIGGEKAQEIHDVLRQSLFAGFHQLQSETSSSIDAVIAAVKVLEEAPILNAGKGAVLTQSGTIELDASIMDGRTLTAGAVAGVRRIRNPILAAHAVMTQTPCVLLVGDEADRFAERIGLDMVTQEYFITPARWNEYLSWQKLQTETSPVNAASLTDGASKGTVGAVARDRHRNLAAATSTGGRSLKLSGRVGDSAVIGAGTFADDRACAVSATGDGELFIRSCAAHDVAARMLYGNQNVVEAAASAIKEIERLGGEGGIIVIDRHGTVTMPYAAAGMCCGSIDEQGIVRTHIYDA